MPADNDDSPDETDAPRRAPGRDVPRALTLPKRFYKSVDVAEVSGGHRITLDGRSIKTPKKQGLTVPSRSLAEVIAAEWDSQGERIDPHTMPMTKLANTAIDAVAPLTEVVAADIVAYAANDLLCYRAADHEGLFERQAARWDPVLDWAQRRYGLELIVVRGVMPVEQDPQVFGDIRAHLATFDAFGLTALHVLTSLTGSALLPIAIADGHLTPDDAWDAAHVDEHWQIERWGQDAEADHRQRVRRAEFDAAVTLLQHS